MNKYSVLLIDDEPLALDVLTHYFKEKEEYTIIKMFTDPLEALAFLKCTMVDLVITDIAMPRISGIDLVKLNTTATKYIMATSFSEYAVESFELNVVDYLLKPIGKERFEKALTHFESAKISEVETFPASFFVKDGDAYVKVIIDQIDFIEGMKDYCKIVCGTSYYLVLKTLKSFEQFLQPHGFQRVHKSYIVPLQKIVQYNGRNVIVNTHTIPVGGVYRERLKVFLQDNRF